MLLCHLLRSIRDMFHGSVGWVDTECAEITMGMSLHFFPLRKHCTAACANLPLIHYATLPFWVRLRGKSAWQRRRRGSLMPFMHDTPKFHCD